MNRIRNLMQMCSLLDQIVEDETDGDQDLQLEVLNRHKKSQKLTRIRERVLRRARTEIWQKKPGTPRWEVCSAKSQPSPVWKPIGYLHLATILGGNHSAWVKMSKTIDMSPIEPQLKFEYYCSSV